MKIAFFVPYFDAGCISGGMRTLLTYCKTILEREQDITLSVVMDNAGKRISADHVRRVLCFYNELDASHPSVNIHVMHFGKTAIPVDIDNHDVIVATGWQTAQVAQQVKGSRRKVLIMQDDEELFFTEAQSKSLNVRLLYDNICTPFCLGHFNKHVLQEKYNKRTFLTASLGAKTTDYHVGNNERTQNICMVYLTIKSCRLPHVIRNASLQLAKALPESKIILFGDDLRNRFNGLSNIEFRGRLSDHQLRELYQSCALGVCLSDSNPSRIGFEMLACGLPIVEWQKGAQWDFPDDVCIKTNEHSIVTDILKLMNDPERRNIMSERALAFAAENTREKECNIMAEGLSNAIWRPLALKIAIHFHVGSEAVLKKMMGCISSVRNVFSSVDVYVTSFLKLPDAVVEQMGEGGFIHVLPCANKGMDIGGKLMFLHHVKPKLESKEYDWVLFLHTKTDDGWREDMCHITKEWVLHAVFTSAPLDNVGIIGAKKYVFEVKNTNIHIIQSRLQQWGLDSKDLFAEIEWDKRFDVPLDPLFYLEYHPDLARICQNHNTVRKIAYANDHWNRHGKNEHERVPNPSLIKAARTRTCHFAAGSIFWARAEYLADLMKLIGDPMDYYSQLETGYIRNIQETQTHSWEYLFGILCEKLGYQIQGIP